MRLPFLRRLAATAVLLIAPAALAAQSPLTPPREALGFEIGADYRLATYSQLQAWWEKLARQSDRMVLDTIGTTAEGRPQLMAIVSSPANLAKLDRYREISRRLALAEGVSEAEARALAREGRAVVWIDGGLHATEVLGAHQLMETLWQFVSMNDPETLRILNDVIILFVHANPDGQELVSSWYMRHPDSTRRSYADIPRLYQKYIGHDNNRDFYLNSQPESKNMSRVLYREWFPQIMYNHHQTGPAGTVMFAPPFRDPFNYNLDPLIPLGIDLVGAAMHNRFTMEGKPGVTMRSGAPYSTWWNGGLRTTAYFHNMIGLLTETIGSPTPMEIPLVPDRQLPHGDLPAPIQPQRWRFRQSIDYSVTANRAVLDLASRYREQFLYNIWLMGTRSIERGSQDSWTIHPRLIDRLKAEAAKSRGQGTGGAPGGQFSPGVPARLFDLLRDPAERDPRGYIIPADQPDFPTAAKLVTALLESGVKVHRATADFEVAGTRYPKGSFVIRTAQAFRPHVLDMFEPQDHPNDFPYPGGPPKPPYDNAGYTLAMQMGVSFDRILDAFDGPFEVIPSARVTAPAEKLPPGKGFLLSPSVNDAYVAVNRVLAAKQPVRRLTEAFAGGGRTWPAGSFYFPATSATRPILARLAEERGLRFGGVNTAPARTVAVTPVRIGLWDRYGGSMPSGWTRWILEQFEFPFEVVYPQRLDAGNLRQAFDVLIFPDDAIPERDAADTASARFSRQPRPEDIPEQYRAMLGNVTVARTVPRLKEFLEAGGRVVTIGSSTVLARHVGLPVADHLVERTPTGTVKPLPREKFYVPGSLLEAAVDTTHPLAFGSRASAIVMYDNSPVMGLAPDAEQRGVKPVAWFASAAPLRSGWGWGQTYLEGGVAIAEATVGKGKLDLFGPEILFRGQPHGTFKFLFNAIYPATR